MIIRTSVRSANFPSSNVFLLSTQKTGSASPVGKFMGREVAKHIAGIRFTYKTKATKDSPEALSNIESKAKKTISITPKALIDSSSVGNVSLPKNQNTKQLRNQNQELSKLDTTTLFNKFWICCKESRIESPTTFYGCFYIGPFDESLSQTLAHNLRRTLLSELSGLAITAVEIEGVLHKFSNLPGVQETVLDIICNLQNLSFVRCPQTQDTAAAEEEFGNLQLGTSLSRKSLNVPGWTKKTKSNTKSLNTETAFLRLRGPGIVKASDIKLPAGIQCVDPDQHIATLAEDGSLNMKIFINEGKNYIKQKPKNNYKNSSNKDLTSTNTNRIYLDSVFMPVTKVNTIVQNNDKCTDEVLESNFSSIFGPPKFKLRPENSLNKEKPELPNIELSKKASVTDQNTTSSFNTLFSSAQTMSTRKAGAGLLPNIQNAATENFFKLKESSAMTSDETTQLESFIQLSDIYKKQQNKQCHIIIEIWTNGSIHPRDALYKCLGFLSSTFMTLENVPMLGSMFKSDLIYKKALNRLPLG